MARLAGRRPSFMLTFSCLFLLFAQNVSALYSVIGIDFGTAYIKATLVKPGIPFEIVLTKDSKRKEVAAVAFKPGTLGETGFPERLYGGDAAALAARFPGDVYSNLKSLLGIEVLDEGKIVPMVGEYSKSHPAVQVVPLGDRNTVAFKSNSFLEEEQPFSIEELLAMELQNIRKNAETMAGKGSTVQNAAITIPAFYTADERKAIETAAELAGLRVMSLVTDGMAVGLNYATSRTFPSVTDGAKPEYHMVFDMGAGSTTATVLRFQSRTVKDVGKYNKTVQEVAVLGSGWDRTLGGDAMNVLIADDMIEKFLAKPEIKNDKNMIPEEVKLHGRVLARLTKDAERIRQVLSANAETAASFESLYKDVDFKYKLSRADFESMASGFAGRVEGPVRQALEAAKLSFADLDSIILHGGVTRTPFVQKKLESLVGDGSKLRTNVNADESAVFGAAFKGAQLAPAFRVKEIRESDIAAYAYELKWTDSKARKQVVFQPTSAVGQPKQVPFKNLEDFEFSLYQQVPTGTGKTESLLIIVKTSNLTKSVAELVDKHGCSKDSIKTGFSIRLDPVNGLPEVVSGSVSCEATVVDKLGSVVDGVKGFFGMGKKDGEQQPLKDGEQASESATEFSSSSSASSGSESAKATESAKADATPSTKTVTIDLSFFTVQGGKALSSDEFTRMQKRLAAFDKSDSLRRQREDVFNSLEGYTYRVRDYLEDEGFQSVTTKEQRAKIQEQLSSTSEWLYSDGSRAGLEAVKSKLKDLEGLVNPVLTRRQESKVRPEFIKMLQDALNNTSIVIDAVKEGVERAEASASSLAAAAKSTVTEAASSASASVKSAAGGDDLDDLEEDVASSSTSSAAPEPSMATYSKEDLSELQLVYNDVKDWLDKKLKEQDKLSIYDDPVISSKELEAKGQRLQALVTRLMEKKLREAKSKTKSTKSKTSKTKSKKTKTKTSSTTEASTSTTPSASAKASDKHDEL